MHHLALRLATAIEMALVLVGQIPPTSTYLPLGGHQMVQIGVVFCACYLVVEVSEILKELRREKLPKLPSSLQEQRPRESAGTKKTPGKS